jgi:hypothetical protein
MWSNPPAFALLIRTNLSYIFYIKAIAQIRLQLLSVRGTENRASVGARANTLEMFSSLSHSHSHFSSFHILYILYKLALSGKISL